MASFPRLVFIFLHFCCSFFNAFTCSVTMNHSDLKTIEFAAYIGLDWADQKHDVCLQENHSHRVESLRLDHKHGAIRNWAADLRHRFHERPLAGELEQKLGALLYALMRYEFMVLYPINPKSLAKAGKTDEAFEAARKIMDADYRSRAMASVAQAMIKNREAGKAKSALNEAQRAAQLATKASERSTRLCR